MANTPKKEHPNRRRDWMLTLGAFLVLQLIFIVCDSFSWSPNFKEGGALFKKISNSKFFTEWFTPYKTSQFNIFTAFFAITLLPHALISAIKDSFSKN
ncbi:MULTISPECIES: YfzA family protein [unclassified Bacillus cereus group]|uniref:YfzA family protein n=1 Tax=unclassified Bacillus cereus group TaxID=2750818 RepID=UPI001F5784AD|nr:MULTISPECIES: YfzA family protein [unclassified Bacillus cereus group]